MTIEEARQFIIKHPEAEFRDDPKHGKFLQAVEVIEAHKGAKLREWAKGPLDNPAFGRMRR